MTQKDPVDVPTSYEKKREHGKAQITIVIAFYL